MKGLIFPLILSSILLTGCGNTGGALSVPCADVYNDGDTSACVGIAKAKPSGLFRSAYAATFLDAGDISRGQFIWSEINLTNNTGAPVDVHLKLVFDVGCDPTATEWVVVQIDTTIPDGGTTPNVHGGWCSGMPLGTHTLTAIAWDSNNNEIDRAIVSFNLIE